MAYDIKRIRADFPALALQIYGRPLVYLDNGASAQKPQIVIDALTKGYSTEYANVHRGLHYLSNLATDKYEAARRTIQQFLGAKEEQEILFTHGATEGFNLIAQAWGAKNLSAGDQVILTTLEHHANIVPWQMLREQIGIELVWIDPDLNGDITPQMVQNKITDKTKMITLTQMSNVIGSILEVKTICKQARQQGIAVAVDGSQSAVHMPIDVQDIGWDFFVVTGHKLYGPSGCGAVYAHKTRLEQMVPWQGGGNMIREVHQDRVSFNDPPHCFEAGTPPIMQIIGWAVAIEYLQSIGMTAIAAYEAELARYATELLEMQDNLTLQGRPKNRGAIFSFTMQGCHAHDISTVLDRYGIAVRAGHHCAQPLMQHLGVTATCRASFAMYNTKEEVRVFVDALQRAQMLFS